MKQSLKEQLHVIDKGIFFVTWLLLLLIALPIIFFPEPSQAVVNALNSWVLSYLGAPYMIFGLFCLGFCLYISYSRYGRIRLGEEDEEPEFKMFSWAAMLFCCGVGAGVVYWGFIEWAYYFQDPPLGLTTDSWQAAEMAPAYGFFHWGPTAWAIYTVSSCAFAYVLFVRKSKVFKVSEGCRGVLGKYTEGICGKACDVFFIFGIVGAVATSLGLANPLVTACICNLFDLEPTIGLQIIILLIIIAMFGVSAFSGLKRGIKFLSNLNVWLAFALVLFVFLVEDPKFFYDTIITATGLMVQNYIRMSTWLDPVGLSGFPQNWTVFYWAWWAGYAPFMGMFFARISRGRTIKQMVMGSLLFGSLGCMSFFGVLGNYGLKLQINGVFDVIGALKANGAAATIVQIIHTLPLGSIGVALVGIICMVFAATSYDSASYIIAANSQKYVQNGESIPWLRLLWAFSLCLIPIGFIMLDASLATLQTATLIFSIPVVAIVIMAGFSFIKMVKEDIQDGKLAQSCVKRDFSELLKAKKSTRITP